jgi:hypothetical protein
MRRRKNLSVLQVLKLDRAIHLPTKHGDLLKSPWLVELTTYSRKGVCEEPNLFLPKVKLYG